MKPNYITRAVIDAAVDRGLREIAEDPHRSIRKLTDMGRRFSRGGRFLDEIYAIMQDLLRNEDSPYYTAIEQLLRHTTRKSLKHFGINLGYNSLTVGSKVIRNEGKNKAFHTPWCLVIRIDPDKAGGISVADIRHFVQRGIDLGIYTFIIRLGGSSAILSDLCALFAGCKDAAFLCLLPDGQLDEGQFQAMRDCTNTLFLFSAGDEATMDNIREMHRQKSLCGVHDCYSDATAEAWLSGARSEALDRFGCAFVILTADDNLSPENRKALSHYAKKLRMQPAHPYIPFDLFYDAIEINRIVSERDDYFEILENGDILTKEDSVLNYRHALSLEQMLSFALPK